MCCRRSTWRFGRKAAAFDPAVSSPMTWLIAIARNRAIDHLRTRGQIPRSRRKEHGDDFGAADAFGSIAHCD